MSLLILVGRWPRPTLLLASLTLLWSMGSCDATSQARAFRVEDRVQLIGGPAAIGELGDYIIENDRIRAVIVQGGNSVGPGMFGGTLVDADLRRPEQFHSAGRGADQFAELFPMVNLVVPGYHDDSLSAPFVGDLDVRIWSDGSDGRCPLTVEEAPDGCAAIRVAGLGDRIIEGLGTIDDLGVSMNISFVTYYVLQPGDNFIQIRTFFWLNGIDGWDFAAAEFVNEEGEYAVLDDEPSRLMDIAAQIDAESSYYALHGEVPIFDTLLGDAYNTEIGDTYRHPGLMAGDFLLYGKNVSTFGTSLIADGLGSNRSGFDISYLFQRRYDRGEIVLARPLANSVLVGVGDRVSYGYFSAVGSVVVPILTSSFTGTFTHAYQCVTATDDEDCGDETSQPFVYDRYFVVGRGDVASVLEAYYEMNAMPTGRVSGHVMDELTGEPVAEARIFALMDTREHLGRIAPDFPGDITSFEDYEDVSLQLRWLDFDGDGEPDDNAGVVSFTAADSGIDQIPNGSFSMRLEPGNYFLVAVVSGRHPGRPIPITVEAGSEIELSLPVSPAGRIHYEVFNEYDEHTTAKLTFIGPLSDTSQCPIDETQPALISALSELRHLELGSSERPQRIAKVVYSENGLGVVELAPGHYDVIVSKGFEYSIDRRCLFVRHDTAPIEVFSLVREVDTTGWVAGDFHVHGQNSYDGSVPHDVRVITAVAEGVEVLSTTDHDYITNLEPVLYDLDMQDELSTLVGLEITPIELGHILGYPLRFDETAVDNGAPDWTRRDECLMYPDAFGCPDNPYSGYIGETPDEMFQMIRELGEFGPEHTVVTVPHPRDGFFGYFDQFAINHFTLAQDYTGLIRGENPLLSSFPSSEPDEDLRFRLYSENFDAIELFNGARYEMIRTPTVQEITGFARRLEEATAESTSDEEFAQRMSEIHDATVREVLHRTPREQAALRYDRFLECHTHSDCDEGEFCDTYRFRCFPDDLPACGVTECPAGYVCAGSGTARRCYEECQTDSDCPLTRYCDTNTGKCERANCNIDSTGAIMDEGPEDGDRPCVRADVPHSEGVVDDWFRLLNYGVFYTGMGNSDTHTLSTEIGLPRNYVLSSAEAPVMIDRREIADNIRAGRVVASYGPFIELRAEGGIIGDVVDVEAEVELFVRVQSPSWFDVDRLEVYANGTLLCDIGYRSELPCDTDAELAWDARTGRNTDIVNFSGVISDDPEVDTWYVVIAMGIAPQSRGLSPVYFASLHPNLGISEIIGQAFATFEGSILSQVIPPPVARPEVNLMVPYALTNPIWVESIHDDDTRWTPPLGLGDPNDPDSRGIPGYRPNTLCQHISAERSLNSSIETAGCRDQPLMPLSTESLGTGNNPFMTPVEADTGALRLRRLMMMQRALMRLTGGGC